MATEKRKFINVMTPRGVAVYPRLNDPDTKFKAEGEYSVKLRMSAEAAAPVAAICGAQAKIAVAVAIDALQTTVKEEKGAKRVAAKKELAVLQADDYAPHSPIKACVDDEGNETGDVEISFKLKASYINKKTSKPGTNVPKIFDAAGKLLTVVPAIWSGSEMKVSGTVNQFYTAKAGAGVTLRLSAVQLLKLVSGSGNNATDYGFGKEEGYEAPEEEDVPAVGSATPPPADGSEPDEF